MRTREDVEASGYTAICVPEAGEEPGCEHHGHMPGVPLHHVVGATHIRRLIENSLQLVERLDGKVAGTMISLEQRMRPGRPEALVEHAIAKAIADLRHAADELEEERLSCFGWAQP